MLNHLTGRYTGVCVALILLAGCSGTQPVPPASALTQSRAASENGHAASWMLPEAETEPLLYISNVNTVTVYSYPKGKLVGTLKGFYRPAGECVDAAGNVYIANLDAFLEYKHGGKKSIKTLTMSGYDAVDCSVDPTTGDLATTWNVGANTTNYVAIYKNASGTPTQYGLKGDFIYYCGYDDQGNLFVDGQTGYKSAEAIFLELPAGASKLKLLNVAQSFEHVGAVQWDGKYVAIGDDDLNVIYRFAVSGSAATLKDTLTLGGTQAVYQWWIDRKDKRVIGPNGLQNSASYWTFPAGGSPTKTLSQGMTAPYGAVVSRPPSSSLL